MYRATTPTHRFIFPADVPISEVGEVNITYAQYGNIILEKNKSDCEQEEIENAFLLTLTQEETKQFDVEALVEVQVVCKIDGKVVAAPIQTFECQRVLNDGVFQ